MTVDALSDDGTLCGAVSPSADVLGVQSGPSRAFVRRSGKFNVLPPGTWRADEASVMNDAGYIAGNTDEQDDGAWLSQPESGWIWHNNHRTYLSALLPDRPQTSIAAVDASGDALGASWQDFPEENGANNPCVTFWRGGSATMLCPKGTPLAIDESGAVYYTNRRDNEFADRDNLYVIPRIGARPIILLTGSFSAVSDRAQSVAGTELLMKGNGAVSGGLPNGGAVVSCPFVYHQGSLTFLRFSPLAVNASGWCVGTENLWNHRPIACTRALLQVGEETYNLDDITSGIPRGAHLTYASCINDRGDILAELDPPFNEDSACNVLLVRLPSVSDTLKIKR